MHIQQIRYFFALCVNFTRAARRCGVSQPSLTGCIKRLEKEMGGQLFARKPSVSVTHLGKAVMPHFRRIARDAEKALSLARLLSADGSQPATGRARTANNLACHDESCDDEASSPAMHARPRDVQAAQLCVRKVFQIGRHLSRQIAQYLSAEFVNSRKRGEPVNCLRSRWVSKTCCKAESPEIGRLCRTWR